jgi:hypothetical protein
MCLQSQFKILHNVPTIPVPESSFKSRLFRSRPIPLQHWGWGRKWYKGVSFLNIVKRVIRIEYTVFVQETLQSNLRRNWRANIACEGMDWTGSGLVLIAGMCDLDNGPSCAWRTWTSPLYGKQETFQGCRYIMELINTRTMKSVINWCRNVTGFRHD